MLGQRRRWGSGPARTSGSPRDTGVPLLVRRETRFHAQRLGRRDRPIAELPSVGIRVLVVAGIAVAVFAVLVFRLWFLQILTGQQYVAAANDNRLRTVKVVARRGLVLDRAGKVLVENKPALTVGIRPMDVPQADLGAVVVRLAAILDMEVEEVFTRVMRSVYVSADEVGAIIADVAAASDVSQAAALRAAMAATTVPRDESDEYASQLRERLPEVAASTVAAAVRKADNPKTGYPYELVDIKSAVGRKVATTILEHPDSYPGVEVREDFVRGYPGGSLAAHVLGQVGEISAEQLEEQRWDRRQEGDVIGQSGVEYTYDQWLRGTDGETKVEVDNMGRPKRAVAGGKLAEAGDNVVLTIDSRIQKATERALRWGIARAHQDSYWNASGGAAVVMNAKNGEILALASYPDYDPGIYEEGLTKKEARSLYSGAANTPLLNRVIQGRYPPGSTYKGIVAVAGLETGVVNPYTSFYCKGLFKTHDQEWKCWVYPDGHGSVSMVSALAQSCDVYFYNLGLAFYRRGSSTELQDWSRRMGLGSETGIDLPGEEKGRVPDYKWLKEYFKGDSVEAQISRLWKPGNSVSLAIGQGFLETTPLQMAVAYAAIANGGYVVTPHVGLKVADGDGRVVRRIRVPAKKKVGMSKATLNVVRQGLRAAASSSVGTSASVFGSYPIPVAGKTGTAEWTFPKDDLAWYASYAPADDPQYVVVVMIEQGGHGGSTAAPATRLIYDALFDIKSSSTIVTGPSD